MNADFEIIRQQLVKSRTWIISAFIICFLVMILIEVFTHSKPVLDAKYLEAKEQERISLQKQSEAFQSLIEVQSKRIEQLSSRDSTLIKSVIQNGDDIKKIKLTTNENIKRFDSYGSNDWARYFSELPEPGQLAYSK